MSPETAGFRHFHDQLQTLKERLLDMSARAEELIDRRNVVLPQPLGPISAVIALGGMAHEIS